jgi:predicted nuclease of predicted toxin-antitoxin system
MSEIEDIRFIGDVNLEKPIVDYLLASGYNIKWIPDLDCRMVDEKLLELANREKRILVTNDKDFGELTFRQKRVSTGIILFRVKGESAKDKVRLLQKLLLAHGNRLRGYFTVVTRKKIRFIPMEDIK